MATAQRDIVKGPIELKGRPLPELEQLFIEHGERKYRAQQVYDGLYIQRAEDAASIQVLPLELRNRLDTEFRSQSVRLTTKQHSEDGTIKFLDNGANGNRSWINQKNKHGCPVDKRAKPVQTSGIGHITVAEVPCGIQKKE